MASRAFRPTFIEPNHSRNVLIEGVKIRNTPFWTVHLLNSRNVLVRDVFIHDNRLGGVGMAMALKVKTNAYRGGAIENSETVTTNTGTATGITSPSTSTRASTPTRWCTRCAHDLTAHMIVP